MADIELPNPEEVEEQSKDSFTRKVALVTAMYALALAITSLGGSNASKEMILAQQQASDQWAFYQAKSIREHIYKSQKLVLETQLEFSTINKKQSENVQKTLSFLEEEQKRYKSEKKEIEDKAKEFESHRDTFLQKDPYFDYAETLLQISVVLASVAMIASSSTVFFVSLAFATLGALLSVNGYFLLIHIPFL